MLHIEKVVVREPFTLDVTFSDRTRKVVDLLPILEGPIFEPLLDPEYFRKVLLDPIAGTVVWPNGADFAPEAIYELPSQASMKRRVARSPN